MPTPLLHDVITGELRSFGRVPGTKRETFIDLPGGALPEWLQVTTGTTFEYSAFPGFARIKTAATASSYGNLQTTRPWNMQSFDCIAVTISGRRLASDSGVLSHGIGLSSQYGTGNGLELRQRSGQSTAELRIATSTGDVIVPIAMALFGSQRGTERRNITLMFHRLEKWAAVLSDNSVIAVVEVPDIVLGAIRPSVYTQVSTATVATLEVRGFQMDWWVN